MTSTAAQQLLGDFVSVQTATAVGLLSLRASGILPTTLSAPTANKHESARCENPRESSAA